VKPLSPWRVEVLRIARTRRLTVLAFLYLFLGGTGPLMARFAKELFSHLSGDSTVTIIVADPRPADGILSYYKSAMQVGLIAAVVITALAVCFDARPTLSVYYRTRSSVRTHLVPRLVVTLLAVCAAYTLGFLFAWYETAALIGAPPAARTVQVWALGLCFTAFAVTLTFALSAVFRGTLATVGTTIAVVLVLPILDGVRGVSGYLPSRLTTIPTALYHGSPHQSPAAAVLVSVAVAGVGAAVALATIGRRKVWS
jgi:ABC-2 type transport system permease protein